MCSYQQPPNPACNMAIGDAIVPRTCACASSSASVLSYPRILRQTGYCTPLSALIATTTLLPSGPLYLFVAWLLSRNRTSPSYLNSLPRLAPVEHDPMRADDLFAELCPDTTRAEWCLNPPTNGTCCGCAFRLPSVGQLASADGTMQDMPERHQRTGWTHLACLFVLVRRCVLLRGSLERWAVREADESSDRSGSNRGRSRIRTFLPRLEPDPSGRICRLAPGLPVVGLKRTG